MLANDQPSMAGLEQGLRRDRLALELALAALTILCWVEMAAPEGAPSGAGRLLPCCGSRFGVAFAMWVVMMAGMMIPAVAPMVLAYAAIARRRAARGARLVSSFISSGAFLAGYLVAWTAFAAVAALAQSALQRGGRLDASLSVGPWAGAVVLLAAGAYQLSPAKDACLSGCRAPVGFFLTRWREGAFGALAMGLEHGLSCVGCCWLLMAILFAVGIMNPLWGAAITLFVVAERVLPWRRTVVWAGGLLCLAGAAVLLYRAAVP
jgi:predicted metal-binding membrane protein